MFALFNSQHILISEQIRFYVIAYLTQAADSENCLC